VIFAIVVRPRDRAAVPDAIDKVKQVFA